MYEQAGRPAADGVRTGHGAAGVGAGKSLGQSALLPPDRPVRVSPPRQGVLQRPRRPLDVAIQGEGFLRIKLQGGRDALTRDGNLQIDGLGRLATNTGALIQPQITIPKGTPEAEVAIGGDGTVTAAGRRVGKLALVTVRSPQALTPIGDNAFQPSAASG